ncbi:hypothetical protein ACF1AB_39790 [Streptomyces sp. NPDC014846]|uniref:hypothetical protein n=1 Tax=Streptomyces sp. NPDC014846 TaxID=3364922 RepID=UPI0036FBD7CE
MTFHRNFIQQFHAWYDNQSFANQAAVQPWTDVPAGLKDPSLGWNTWAADVSRIANHPETFASADELGQFIEGGVHNNFLHAATASFFNEPAVAVIHSSPTSTYFYQLHGLVHNWWNIWEAHRLAQTRLASVGSSFAVSTASGVAEAFRARSDGMVFANARNSIGFWNNPINNVAPKPGSADPRTGIAAVSTAPGVVQAFWVRSDGMVFTNVRNPSDSWNNPINNVAPNPGSADPRAGIAAVSTAPGVVEVFWVRPDGMVFTNVRNPNGTWNNPINNVAPNPGSADPRAGIAAVSTAPGVVEVFWVRPDGMVFTNVRNPNGTWNNPINNVAPNPGSAALPTS